MNVEKIKRHENKYTAIKNAAMRDPNLSLKAKGLLAYMIGKPIDWEFNIRSMCGELKESKDTVAGILLELIKVGYVTRKKLLSATKQFEGMEYHVYQTPGHTLKDEPCHDLPDTGNKDIPKKEKNTNKEGGRNASARAPQPAREPTPPPKDPPILKTTEQEVIIGSSATVAVIDTQEPETTVLRLEPSEYGDLVNDLKDILTPYSDQNLIIEPEHKAKIIEIALRDNYGTRAVRQAWADFQEKRHGAKFHWFYKDILSDPVKLKKYERKPEKPQKRCDKHKTVIFGDFCRDCAEEQKAVYRQGEPNPLTDFLREYYRPSTLEVQK